MGGVGGGEVEAAPAVETGGAAGAFVYEAGFGEGSMGGGVVGVSLCREVVQREFAERQVHQSVEGVGAVAVPAKILRDCRLKGDGVHHAMLGVARMHNLALAG